jgi:hyperosmotically inducible protein
MKLKELLTVSILAGSLIGTAALAEGDKMEKTGKAVDDTWITTKVKADLVKDSETKAHEITVNTKAGVVVLTGTVASIAEKNKAEKDARSVKGVVDVENQLTVANAKE